MSDILLTIGNVLVLAGSIGVYVLTLRSARKAKASAEEANLAYLRAHDSAMEAEENANRTENA